MNGIARATIATRSEIRVGLRQVAPLVPLAQLADIGPVRWHLEGAASEVIPPI